MNEIGGDLIFFFSLPPPSSYLPPPPSPLLFFPLFFLDSSPLPFSPLYLHLLSAGSVRFDLEKE